MKFNYSLSKDGYIVVHNNESRLLLDTGAPYSFGTGLAGIPGVTATPLANIAGFTTQNLSKSMEHHVDGVIGAEVLQRRTIHLDPISKTVDFSNTEIAQGRGNRIWDKMNVPVIEVSFDGKVIPTIFDTGAPLGYVPRELINGREPIGSFDDFYPLCGTFRTDVFEILVRIGSLEEVIHFGVLPEDIEQIHVAADTPTIIGLGLLENYKISLGMRERLIKLEPLG